VAVILKGDLVSFPCVREDGVWLYVLADEFFEFERSAVDEPHGRDVVVS